MPGQVAVVGSLNLDLVLQAPRIPAPGETVLGACDLLRFPGGKGANQAFAAANLGARVHMIGRVGVDDFAAPVLASLASVGVDTRFVIRDEQAATGIGMIVVDAGGQNAITVASGANAAVTLDDISAAEATIGGSDVLLLQLEIPMPAIVAAAKVAQRHGVTTILNPAPAQPLSAELLSRVNVLIANETEAAILTGMPIESDADIELTADALRATGVETIIVTRGSRGCARIGQNTLSLHPAFGVEVVDTTAAGDAFVGGFAAALAAGSQIETATVEGNAAGALACTRLGAQASLPARSALNEFLRSESVLPPNRS